MIIGSNGAAVSGGFIGGGMGTGSSGGRDGVKIGGGCRGGVDPGVVLLCKGGLKAEGVTIADTGGV